MTVMPPTKSTVALVLLISVVFVLCADLLTFMFGVLSPMATWVHVLSFISLATKYACSMIVLPILHHNWANRVSYSLPTAFAVAAQYPIQRDDDGDDNTLPSYLRDPAIDSRLAALPIAPMRAVRVSPTLAAGEGSGSSTDGTQ